MGYTVYTSNRFVVTTTRTTRSLVLGRDRVIKKLFPIAAVCLSVQNELRFLFQTRQRPHQFREVLAVGQTGNRIHFMETSGLSVRKKLQSRIVSTHYTGAQRERLILIDIFFIFIFFYLFNQSITSF
jgi:hypothetical protein